MQILTNQKGQGLIEYLIIVALVAVASITVMKVVGGNVNAQFGNIARVLSGRESTAVETHQVTGNMVRKKDFSDFFEDAVNQNNRGNRR
ncbi:MAG: Flp family type IVb pilin [Pseudobdellovibrionaceae bacterium]|jgi:pilus assembly protein Flp/PilA